MINGILSEWNRLTHSISKLHDEPVFLPASFIKGTILPKIFVVAFTLTIIYLISFQFVNRIIPANTDAVQKSKVCYQITNTLFNIFVGTVGLYLEYWVLPSLPAYNGSSVDRILGNEEELYLVSALQLGYQFWAIPVGILYVHESREMVLHHLAVVVSTSMTGFLTIGFRWYSPFFYGIMELSSLPLCVMNSFKDNPKWIEKYPSAFGMARNIFAVSFLLIRLLMSAWRSPVFLRDNFIVMYTKEWGAYKVYMFVQWFLASFLAYLQLYWGSLIIKGILKIIFPKEKGFKKAKKE
jgi:hypothetical protein